MLLSTVAGVDECVGMWADGWVVELLPDTDLPISLLCCRSSYKLAMKLFVCFDISLVVQSIGHAALLALVGECLTEINDCLDLTSSTFLDEFLGDIFGRGSSVDSGTRIIMEADFSHIARNSGATSSLGCHDRLGTGRASCVGMGLRVNRSTKD